MGSVAEIFRFILAMALVLALAWVAARTLKRIGFGKASPSRFLNQIDYLSLGPKRGVALVQVVDKTVALGVTDQSVTFLMEIKPEAMAERATEGIDNIVAPASLSQFAEEMIRRLKRDAR